MDKNNIIKNYYIEESVWRHIIKWLINLIIPLTFIDIIMFIDLINRNNNNAVLWIIFIIIIVVLHIVLYHLLKDTERLVNNLQKLNDE